MSDTVGRIDLILDVDGKGLPGKVRRAGEKAGSEAGEGFNDNFNDEITKGAKERNKKIGEEGRKAGESYSDARDRILQKRNKGLSDRLAKVFETPKGMSDYVNKFDTAQEAIAKMREELKELHKQNLISDEDFKQNNATLTKNRRALIRAKDAANSMAQAQERMNRDWDEAIQHNKAFDRAIQTNQRNIQRWRREIEGNLNRSLADLARRQRQIEKDSANWAKALERAGVAAERTRARMDRLRISVGNTFRDGDKGIDRYVNKFPTVREGVTRLRDDLVRLREQNIITNHEFERSITHLTNYTRNVRNLDTGLQRVERTFGRAGGSIKKFNGNARQMPYILKQIAGYSALFTALAPAIAVLGSATGSGALALSTGVGALALGIVTLIPAFKGMLDDIDKLPEKARPAAQALQDMAGPLSDLQDTIQEGVFDGLGPQITRLSSKIFPRLERGFGKTAKTINGLFRDLIRNLTSKNALKRFDSIFDGLQPILQHIGRALIHLTGAFAKLFEAALPSGKKLAEFLNDIFADFNKWLSTTEGQRALTKFFDHLDEIMPSVGRLIGAAGRAVAGLVTDKAVDNLTKFLDTMSEAIPGIVGGFGELVDSLDPLGLASEALKGLGDFMSDHKGDFTELGAGIKDFIKAGAELVGPIIKGIADQLLRVGPDVFQDLADGLAAINTPELQAAVKDALPKLGDALEAAGEAVGSLLKALGDSGVIASAIKTIGDASKVATPLLTALSIALDTLTGDFEGAADKMKGLDLEGVFSSFGSLLGGSGILGPLGVLVGGLDLLQQKLTGISLASSFGSIGKELQKWVDDFAKVFPGAMRTLLATANAAIKALPNLIGTIFKALFGFGGGGGGGDTKDAEKAGKQGVDAAKKAADARIKGITGIGPALVKKLLGNIGDFDFTGPARVVVEAFIKAITGFNAAKTKISDWIGGLFDGGGKDDKPKGAGKKAQGSFLEGLTTITEGAKGLFDKLFGGDGGAGKAKESGAAAGQSYTGGLAGGLEGAKAVAGAKGSEAANAAKSPFGQVPAAIGLLLNPLPSVVGGIMGLVSGKPGADNTKNPFSGVLGAIKGFVSGVPGAVTGKVGESSGKKGANATSNPFAPLLGIISGMVSAIPGKVSAKVAEASGQKGANNTSEPFNGVGSKIRGYVSGVPGIVTSALSGVSASGAADRIVSAFSGVAGRVRSALSGLSGVVNAAIGGAKAALAGGLAQLRVPKTATGGTFSGAQMRIIGEAGPEAVVPLDRPLSQVDPSVRELSRIAQGKFPAASSEGGTGKSITVAEGAIIVQAPNSDSEQVASAVLDRIVAKL